MKPTRLVLASKSPRRQQLLSTMGLSFDIRTKDTDESFPGAMPVHEVAPWLATKKAKAFEGELADGELLLTADTVVIVDGAILGKPESTEEAVSMLRQLSGRSHEVVTGVCLKSNEAEQAFADTTRVHFAPLGIGFIEHYIATCQPFDKAGSYGAQDLIGLVGIERLEGSFYTVMGLPTHVLFRELYKLGFYSFGK